MRFSIPGRNRSHPLLFLIAVAAVGTVLVGSCARPRAEDPAEIRAGIVATEREFMAAFAAHDAAAIGLTYAEDAAVLPPNADAVHGRDAITKFWESMLILPVKELRLELLDVYGTGDFATSEGRYTLVGDRDRPIEVGKYLVVWKKTAQGWRMYRDLWNADAPASASPSDTTAASGETAP